MDYSDYCKNIRKLEFYIDGKGYSYSQLLLWSKEESDAEFEKKIKRIISSWLDDSPTFEVQTSGSTGRPKTIKLEKSKIYHSALMSLKYFNLKPRNKVLLVLPADKIGGMMLIIRALIGGLDLCYLKPKLNPFISTSPVDFAFCSLTPAQLASIIIDEKSLIFLQKIKKVLLGGAAVSKVLHKRIKKEENQYFLSYGMTETISHVAIKTLNGPRSSIYFQALEGVSFEQNSNGQLIIEAELILDKKLLTNDIVRLHGEQRIEWLGRADNVVNSGGVKLMPELIEAKISARMNTPFYFVGEEDEILGERLVLIVEKRDGEEESQQMIEMLELNLKKLELPKCLYFTEQIHYTKNGKLMRLKPHQLSFYFEQVL